MKIYTYNLDTGISYAEVRAALKAVNYQIKQHWNPVWHMPATLLYRAASAAVPHDEADRAVLYITDIAHLDGALGYHSRNNLGTPYSFVFTDFPGVPWSWTLSHEALEIIADPYVNLYADGPHPSKGHLIFAWYEVCDPVQDDSYKIDGVVVSNFVFPHYFTPEHEPGIQNDYLNTGVKSFGVNRGGWFGYWNPKTGKTEYHTRSRDAVARDDLAAELKVPLSRTSRYANATDEVKNGTIRKMFARLRGKGRL
jgi:hypothetical protein